MLIQHLLIILYIHLFSLQVFLSVLKNIHFAYYTANNHRTEYISFLNDKFKELVIRTYQKNMNDIFMILMEHGNPKLAIRYAKRIMKDGAGRTPTEIAPGTKLYELVGELAKYLLEEVQERFTN